MCYTDQDVNAMEAALAEASIAAEAQLITYQYLVNPD